MELARVTGPGLGKWHSLWGGQVAIDRLKPNRQIHDNDSNPVDRWGGTWTEELAANSKSRVSRCLQSGIKVFCIVGRNGLVD